MNVTYTKTCLSLVLLTALLGACSSTPIAPAAAPKAVAAASSTTPAPMTPPRTASGPAVTSAPASQVATVSTPAYLDPKSDIATGRSVYFNFDDALLRPEFSALVERHGRYLMSNPKLAIRIEGNTDERGSAEYNLALGQKRAEAVRQALKVVGVRDAQMEAVSWGEEKPKAKGHDESDWAQNRRADLQYPSK
jgi:peptidoglycan-associated lipoprotein